MKRGCQLTRILWLTQPVILLSTPCFLLILSAYEISDNYFSYLKVLWGGLHVENHIYILKAHMQHIAMSSGYCHFMLFCKALAMPFVLKRPGSLGRYWKVPLSTIKFKSKQTNNLASWFPEECQHKPWWALTATSGAAQKVTFSWTLRYSLPQSPSFPLSHVVNLDSVIFF